MVEPGAALLILLPMAEPWFVPETADPRPDVPDIVEPKLEVFEDPTPEVPETEEPIPDVFEPVPDIADGAADCVAEGAAFEAVLPAAETPDKALDPVPDPVFESEALEP